MLIKITPKMRICEILPTVCDCLKPVKNQLFSRLLYFIYRFDVGCFTMIMQKQTVCRRKLRTSTVKEWILTERYVHHVTSFAKLATFCVKTDQLIKVTKTVMKFVNIHCITYTRVLVLSSPGTGIAL